MLDQLYVWWEVNKLIKEFMKLKFVGSQYKNRQGEQSNKDINPI